MALYKQGTTGRLQIEALPLVCGHGDEFYSLSLKNRYGNYIFRVKKKQVNAMETNNLGINLKHQAIHLPN